MEPPENRQQDSYVAQHQLEPELESAHQEAAAADDRQICHQEIASDLFLRPSTQQLDLHPLDHTSQTFVEPRSDQNGVNERANSSAAHGTRLSSKLPAGCKEPPDAAPKCTSDDTHHGRIRTLTQHNVMEHTSLLQQTHTMPNIRIPSFATYKNCLDAGTSKKQISFQSSYTFLHHTDPRPHRSSSPASSSNNSIRRASSTSKLLLDRSLSHASSHVPSNSKSHCQGSSGSKKDITNSRQSSKTSTCRPEVQASITASIQLSCRGPQALTPTIKGALGSCPSDERYSKHGVLSRSSGFRSCLPSATSIGRHSGQNSRVADSEYNKTCQESRGLHGSAIGALFRALHSATESPPTICQKNSLDVQREGASAADSTCSAAGSRFTPLLQAEGYSKVPSSGSNCCKHKLLTGNADSKRAIAVASCSVQDNVNSSPAGSCTGSSNINRTRRQAFGSFLSGGCVAIADEKAVRRSAEKNLRNHVRQYVQKTSNRGVIYKPTDKQKNDPAYKYLVKPLPVEAAPDFAVHTHIRVSRSGNERPAATCKMQPFTALRVFIDRCLHSNVLQKVLCVRSGRKVDRKSDSETSTVPKDTESISNGHRGIASDWITF